MSDFKVDAIVIADCGDCFVCKLKGTKGKIAKCVPGTDDRGNFRVIWLHDPFGERAGLPCWVSKKGAIPLGKLGKALWD